VSAWRDAKKVKLTGQTDGFHIEVRKRKSGCWYVATGFQLLQGNMGNRQYLCGEGRNDEFCFGQDRGVWYL
jgi:hypothetical protein